MSISNSKKEIGAILCVSLLLLIACRALLVSIYDRPNWKTMAVAKLEENPRVLFLGSSRFFFGIDPREYNFSTLNLACDYMDAATMERLWNEYEDRLRSVEVVVVEGGLSPLYYNTAQLAPDSIRDLGLRLYPTWQSVVRDPVGWMRELLWPFLRWRLTPDFWHRFQNHLADTDEPQGVVAGFVPSNARLTFSDEFTKREIANAGRMMKKVTDEHIQQNREALKRLVGSLLGSGRKVIYLRMPVYKTVWNPFPEAWSRKVKKEMQKLESEFPQLILWNEWKNGAFVEKDFRDPDHFNALGAQKFADYLEPKVQTILH